MWDLSHIRRDLIKNPNTSSTSIFEALKKFASVTYKIKRQILTKKREENILLWAKK